MKNQQKKRILIISAANPTRAYSGLKYLFFELKKRKNNVIIWASVPKCQSEEYRKWGNNAQSFMFNILGSLPKIRKIWRNIKAFLVILEYRREVIICHELTFYKLCTYIKKIFPDTVIIHYCTELFDENSPKYFQKQLKFYEQHANVPDLIIECDEMRRIFRKKKYCISKPTVTIYNTLPENELKKFLKEKKNIHEIPIITYTGAAYGHRQLNIIVSAVKKINTPFHLNLFVYGPKHSIEELEKLCLTELGKDKFTIIVDTPREELFDRVVNSDIGIVYYNPLLSIGNKYASPTKFFEYVAMGIPVVSSNNDSLMNLIDKYNLGVYVKDQTVLSLTQCITKLLEDCDLRKKISINEMKAFHDVLCYEIQSKKAFEQIEKLVYNKGFEL